MVNNVKIYAIGAILEPANSNYDKCLNYEYYSPGETHGD